MSAATSEFGTNRTTSDVRSSVAMTQSMDFGRK
jgi:hypothetical protein